MGQRAYAVRCPEYQIRPVVQLHWTSWNDEYIVFDETSGQTHQLDAVRAFVLHLMVEKSQTKSSLLAELPVASPLLSSVVDERLELILAEFQSAGLLEAIDQ